MNIVEKGRISVAFIEDLSTEAVWNELEANKLRFVKAVERGSISSRYRKQMP